MNEQFSAFLDGEATRDEADSVINAVLRDEALKTAWSRQHWLRTTLRAHKGEITAPLDAGFSDRVMAAITADEQSEHSSRPAIGPRRASVPGLRRRRWRNMVGLAAVASATGVFLLVSNPLQSDKDVDSAIAPTTSSVASVAVEPQTAPEAMPQVAQSRGLETGMLNKATASAGPRQKAALQQASPADHWSVSDPAIANELNSYLVEHNGMARGYGLSGTTPAFVRVATYGQETAQ